MLIHTQGSKPVWTVSSNGNYGTLIRAGLTAP